MNIKKTAAILTVGLCSFPFAGCAGGTSAEQASTEQASAGQETTDTESCDDLTYISFGSGDKAFVIFPGLSVKPVVANQAALEEAFTAFTEDYTVYVFEGTDELSDSVTIRGLAEESAVYMQQLGIQNAVVYGVSMGGMEAQYLAIDHPDLVSGIILASTACRIDKHAEDVMNEWLSAAEERDEEKLTESMINAIYSPDTVSQYGDMLRAASSDITKAEYRKLITEIQAMLTFNCRDELGGITCPTFVLGSEGDAIFTADAMETIADQIGENAELYLYGNEYGHAVYDEAPDFIGRIKEWTDQIKT